MSCFRFAVVLGLLILVGCSSEPLTLRGAATKPVTEIATIRSWGNGSFLNHIDDEKIDPWYGKEFQVEPGEHTVGVYYGKAGPPTGGPGFGGGGGASLTIGIYPNPHNLTFTTEKGHEYEAGYPTMWIGRKPYVKDLTTGKDLTDVLIDGKP